VSLAVGAANATDLTDSLKKGLEKVVTLVESCLELQFIKAWKYVCNLTTTLIDVSTRKRKKGVNIQLKLQECFLSRHNSLWDSLRLLRVLN
jgi:hypothetical protein